MRISKICLPLMSVALAMPAAAQEPQVLRGPAPSWAIPSSPIAVPDDAQGMLFVRRSDAQAHFDADGQISYVGQRIRILHPQALQAGNVGMAWNPAVGMPTVHKLLIHRDGQAIDVLETSDFEILRREDQLEQAMLDGMLTAVLRVPDLRVGDELELDYSVRSNDPTMGVDSYGVLFLADAPPPGRFRLSMSWEEGQKPNFRMTDDFGASPVQEDRRLTLTVDNPDIISAPSDAPPRYSWTRMVQYSDFDEWADVSRRFHPIFEAATKLESASPVLAEAERIRAAYDNDLERARAALELVQQQVRYIYVGLNGGNLSPASADETWQRRYGDCKGKTVLLMALLDQLGIEAEAVLASNLGADDGLDQRLPNPGLFDHVLVRATIDGDLYWMDGTMPVVVGASDTPAMPYRFVLPLADNGAALEALPWSPHALPQDMNLIDIDARDGFDAPARKTQISIKRGPDAIAEYMQLSAVAPNQLENAIRTNFTGSGSWDSVDKVEYRFDEATRASILTISGVAPVDWDDDEEGKYSFNLPSGGFYPPNRHQRAEGQDKDAPYYNKPTYSCHVTTLRLPAETDVNNWWFNTLIDTKIFGRLYYRVMERRDDGTIRMVRGSRTDDMEISPQRAERDNGRLSKFDNSMADVGYDPGYDNQLDDDMPSVPAVDEVDWTGTDVPCLPADVLKG